MRSFTVVLSPERSMDGYSVTAPAVPGAISGGTSREEALGNIVEAIEGVLAVMHEDGYDALEETPELIAAEVEKILGFRQEFGWDLVVETAVVQVDLAAVA
ncbi:MAG: HicB family protein [Anaerolinea sp.]|nr:HicB family protein [Anaerolinea sp.]